MKYIKLFVAGIPASKGSYNIGANGKPYPADPKLKKWEDTVSWMARKFAPDTPSIKPIDLTLEFIMDQQPGVLIEIREHDEDIWHTRTPDIDKTSRAVIDALQKAGIYNNDSQVSRLEAIKIKRGMG